MDNAETQPSVNGPDAPDGPAKVGKFLPHLEPPKCVESVLEKLEANPQSFDPSMQYKSNFKDALEKSKQREDTGKWGFHVIGSACLRHLFVAGLGENVEAKSSEDPTFVYMCYKDFLNMSMCQLACGLSYTILWQICCQMFSGPTGDGEAKTAEDFPF